MCIRDRDKAQEALDKAGSAEGGVSDDDLDVYKRQGYFYPQKPYSW